MSKKTKFIILSLGFIAGIIFGMSRDLFSQSATKNSREGSGSKSKPGSEFSYEGYAKTLGNYVDDDGMVGYRSLKADRKSLDSFVAPLAALDREVYKTWSEKEKIAFWINAYNSLTLVSIIDHYPIEASFVGKRLYPENSIRQISGVWTEKNFTIMGRKMSLDDIEHVELRAQFNEPRIHVALVCAAMSCPNLRNEPFHGDRLDDQLDDQSRRMMSQPKKFRIDRTEGKVHLSKIFEWFGEDFVKTYGTDAKFKGQGRIERAVLNFVSQYLSDEDRKYLETGDYDVEYLHYDWSLNEKKED